MSEERQIDALLDAALDTPEAELSNFLDQNCPPQFRSRVDLLLAAGSEGTLDLLKQDPPFHLLCDETKALDVEPPAVFPDQGERIGPYRVGSVLGRGGMGVVYEASRDDGQFDQVVALKLSSSVGRQPCQSLSRFKRERQILAGLDHPNIARLLDGGLTEDGRPYFVMERVQGRDIDVYCDSHRLSLDQRLRLFVRVGRAVAAAHQRLVVHRDLKPSNILVSDSGEVKLLDFGIAKQLDPNDDELRTATDRAVMTPEFASPEQMLGEAITTATDVYQLGLLLYLLLTGRRAYELDGLAPMGLVQKVVSQEPSRPSTAVSEMPTLYPALARAKASGQATAAQEVADRRNTSLSKLQRALRGDLDNLVLKALRKEPERRYASVSAMVDDVERYLTGLPISARPDTAAYRLGKMVRRHAGVFAVGAIALIMVIALIIFDSRRLRHERDNAQRQAQRAEQISEMLVEVFTGADPYSHQGEEPTARELLDRGAERLDSLDNEPELAASMRHTLGRIYNRLGHYSPARQQLTSGLAGQDLPPLMRVKILTELSNLEVADGQYEAAQGHLDAIFQLIDQGRLNNRHYIMLAWSSQGQKDRRNGDLEAAWEAVLKAEQIGFRTFPDGHEDLATVLNRKALVARDLGHLATARDSYTAAINMLRQVASEGHPNLPGYLSNLGVLESDEAQFSKAYKTLTASLEAHQRIFGQDHPLIGRVLSNIGLVQEGLGQYQEAYDSYLEASELLLASVGPEHPNMVMAYGNLAGVTRRLDRLDQAFDYVQRAKKPAHSVLGAEHPVSCSLASLEGDIVRRQGRLDEALKLQTTALVTAEKTLPPTHPFLVSVLIELGMSRLQNRQPVEALAVFRRAFEIAGSNVAPQHPDLGLLHVEMADALWQNGRSDEARSDLLNGLDILRQADGAGYRTWLEKALTLSQAMEDESLERGYQAALAGLDA